jgi:hypothetical protein
MPAFDLSGVLRWLAPAMGCFVLMAASLKHPEAVAAGDAERLAFSAPGQSVRGPASSEVANNNVPVTTLEWTFGRPSSSSNASFVRTETNTLTQ